MMTTDVNRQAFLERTDPCERVICTECAPLPRGTLFDTIDQQVTYFPKNDELDWCGKKCEACGAFVVPQPFELHDDRWDFQNYQCGTLIWVWVRLGDTRERTARIRANPPTWLILDLPLEQRLALGARRQGDA